MADTNVYKCTPRQAHGMIVDCIEAKLVPNMLGSPGVGKSSIMRNVAKFFRLKLIDHRLSTSAPEDLSGLPRFIDKRDDAGIIVDSIASFTPFDIFPLDTTPVPEGYDGWMIFFDEMNSAGKSVQAASYKTILDKMVGQRHLHSNVVITAAGNLATDRAIVNPISTAMQSRVVTFVLETNLKEWMEDVALPENYDPRILAFLNYKPAALMDFRPDHNEHTFCCPRTWSFMNDLIKNKPVVEMKTALYAGTITSGVAVEFVQFTKVFESLPTIERIVGNPTGTDVPQDAATRWATISHCLEHVTEDIFGPVSTYINRFTMEFRVLFFRGLLIRHPKMRTHPEFRNAMLELSKYLND